MGIRITTSDLAAAESRGVTFTDASGKPVTFGGVKPNPGSTARQKLKPDSRWITSEQDLTGEDGSFTFGLALVTKNTNTREHHMKRALRVSNEKSATMAALMAHPDKRERLAAGCVVTLKRISVRKMDKEENLRVAFKAIKDAIAQWLYGGNVGQHDEDERVTWVYEQAKWENFKGVVVTLKPKEM